MVLGKTEGAFPGIDCPVLDPNPGSRQPLGREFGVERKLDGFFLDQM
jgi:hypothetical protein